MLKIKRIYDHDQDYQSYRILVDRMWPRGISKDNAKLNDWAKEIAPSVELRKWFAHDPEKFADFQIEYQKELDLNPYTKQFIATVKKQLTHGDVTLLYGAKDTKHNQAIVLKHYLEQKLNETD